MKTHKNGPNAPAELQGHIPNLNVLRKTVQDIAKIAIILLICSSCATMSFNGVKIKPKKQAVVNQKERRVFLVTFVLGYAIGYHYKEKFQHRK